MVVPLSMRLMPLFEPSTTFLMVTVAVEESVGLTFKEILSEKVTLVAAGAAGAVKEGVEVSAPARVTVGRAV